MNPGRSEPDKTVTKAVDERKAVSAGESFDVFQNPESAQTVADRFEEQVRLYPDRIAVKTPQKAVTYSQLDDTANRLAAVLAGLDCDLQLPVSLLTGRNEKQSAGIIGIFKAERILVPMESLLTTGRIKAILDDSLARIIVTDDDNLALAEEVSPVDGIIVNMDNLASAPPSPPKNRTVGPDDPALVIYTTGTMGEPKGVMHPHRNLMHYVRSFTEFMGIAASDRILQPNPGSFIVGLRVTLRALLNGAALYPVNVNDMGLNSLKQWLIDEKITLASFIPPVFRSLFGSLEDEERFPDLRLVFLGGESLGRSDVDLFFKHASPDARIGNGLGSTETGWTTRCFIARDDIDDKGIMPVGFPCEDKEVFLVDPAGKDVPPGETGEIVVQSRFISPGYWSKGMLYPEKLFTCLGENRKKVYRTGDLGRFLPDGRLVVLGRNDSQVKVRGQKVNLADVEAAIRALSGVREVKVLQKGKPCEERLEGGLANRNSPPRLTAYIVPAKEVRYSAGNMRNLLSNSIPHHMIPSSFVFLENMPLNPNGKIDWRALLEREDALIHAGRGRPDSADALQSDIAAIWEKNLDCPGIGPDDNFFDLGGDSLAAIAVCDEVEKLTGCKISPVALLQAPTVESMCRLLRRPARTASGVFSIVPIQPAGDRPPFILVPGMLGDGFRLRNLSPYLCRSQPFYALNIRGMKLSDNGEVTMENLAAELVRSILAFQPRGPYYLGGFSYGGHLAWEIAQQLRNAGHSIAVVIIIDTRLRGAPLFRKKSATLAGKFGDRLFMWLQSLKHQVLILSYLQGFSGRCRHVAKWIRRKLRRPFFPGSAKPARRTKELETIHRCYLEALHRYKPKAYSGRVVLIRGSIHYSREAYRDKSLGWRDLAGDTLEIHEVPGHHNMLIREPFARITAETIDRCLEKAQAKQGKLESSGR